MLIHLSGVESELFSWLLASVGVLYVGMVMMRYRTDGARYPLGFDFRRPGSSVGALAVWLGVKVLDNLLLFASITLSVLLEASAEVGEWFMRRNPSVRQTIRSRFLV